MKRKKIDWSRVPWTPFVECEIPLDAANTVDRPSGIYRNSRYQVTVYRRMPKPEATQMFGPMWHLSLKVHDRQAHHDWRDMQRIKNELCGPEYDAVEVYPKESKLVDSANQYHLWVFEEFTLPFGFGDRLVGDANWNGSKQRPWPKGERPADCMDAAAYDEALDRAIARAQQVPLVQVPRTVNEDGQVGETWEVKK